MYGLWDTLSIFHVFSRGSGFIIKSKVCTITAIFWIGNNSLDLYGAWMRTFDFLQTSSIRAKAAFTFYPIFHFDLFLLSFVRR